MARTLIASVFGLRCPSCREGKLFRNRNPYKFKQMADMHEKCDVCGQKFELEPSFYYGAMYVSYAYSVAIFVAVVVIALWIFDLGIWNMIVLLSITLFAAAPAVFRLARSTWAHMFIKYRRRG